MVNSNKSMRVILFVTAFSLFLTLSARAQNEVAIGSATTKSNAILWLNGNGSQGLILPVVTNKTAVSNPDKGMIVYDNSDNKVWYRNDNAWVEVGGGSSSTASLNLQFQGNLLRLREGTTVLSEIPFAAGTQNNGSFLVFQGGSWQFGQLTGDVTGLNGAIQVTGIRGKNLATLPASAQALVYDPAANAGAGGWIFQSVSIPTLANGQILTGNGTTNSATTLAGDATLSGGTLTISNNAITTAKINTNAVDATKLADNAVTSAKIADATITGADIANATITGSNIAPNTVTADKLAQSAAVNGQVLKWNGTNWVPAFDEVVTGDTPTLSNGQILIGDGTTNSAGALTGDATLSGSTLTINNNAITTAKINANAVDGTKLADNSVTSTKITDGAITGADIAASTITADKLAQSAASSGQVLKWNGTNWAPAADDAGAGATPTLSNGQILIGDGTTNSAAALTGDATLAGGALTISNNAITNAKINANAVDGTKLADNAVTSAKITDATITGADIANTTITADKLAQSGASNNQVLQWNGTAWVPATQNFLSGTLNSGQILVGNAANAATPITVGGDATINNTGILTIFDNAVTSQKIADASITGVDIANTSLPASKLAQSGAANNDVLQWNGTAWVPVTLTTGGTVTQVNTGAGLTGGPITNSGTISIASGGVGATELADNAVTTLKVADNAITTAKINTNAIDGTKLADNAVTSAKITDATITGADIADATITADKIAQSAATSGQVLKWNGTNWAPAADDAGAGATPTLSNGQILIGNGSTNSAAALTGDATLAGGTLTISNNAITTAKINANAVDATKIADGAITNLKVANDAITSAKISDGTITGTDVAAATITGSNIANTTITGANIAATTITTDKLAQSAASSGQVLQFNGTNWVPSTLSAGGDMLRSTYDTNSDNIVDLAATVTTNANLTGPVTSVGNATSIANGAITNAMLANTAVTNLSGTNTGDQTITLTGDITGSGTGTFATTLATVPIAKGGTGATDAASARTNLGLGTLSTANTITTAEITDGTITGTDIAATTITGASIAATTITADKLAQSTATNGQVLKWNGTNWAPAADEAGVGATPTLSNGQILTGDGTTNSATALSGDATLTGGVITISNNAITTAKINANAVDATKLADGAVSSLKIADGTVTGTDIAAGTINGSNIANTTITGANIAATTITADKLAPSSATNGQVLQFNGTNWFPSTLSAGGDMLRSTYDTNSDNIVDLAATVTTNANLTGPVTSVGNATSIANGAITNAMLANTAVTNLSGTNTGDQTITLTGDITGSGTGTFATTLATVPIAKGGTGATDAASARTNLGLGTLSTANTITTAEITDGTITGTDIAATTITADKLAQSAATSGQVLKWNGTNWAPAADDAGTTTPVLSNGQILTGNGTTNSASTLSGDATLAGGVITIANDAVTSTKIADGTIAAADLAAGSVSGGTGGVITDASITNDDIAAAAAIAGTKITPAFGAQNISTTGTLSAGVTTVSGLTIGTSAWPANAVGVLTNDGAGALTWEASSGWNLTGNSGTNPATNFIGTTDAQPLRFNTGVGGLERMRITETGNVGIGTITPNAPLQFAASLANRKIVLFEAANNDHEYFGFGINSAELRYQTDKNSSHVFYSGVNSSSSAELMRIRSDGNVGIGTATPTAKLDIGGVTGTGLKVSTASNNLFDYAISATNSGTGDVAGFFLTSDPVGGPNSHAVYGQANGQGFGVFGANDGTTGGAARFMNFNPGNNNPVVNILNNGTGPALTTDKGHVGIGTLNPLAQFHVSGNGDTEWWKAAMFLSQTGSNARTYSLSVRNNGFFQIGDETGSSERLVISPTGDIGIGTFAPTAKLDIVGTIKIADGTQAAGRVLTSDVNGLASWQPAAGGGFSTLNTIPKGDGTTLVASSIFDDGTNVGIGTVAVPSPLTIAGNTHISGNSSIGSGLIFPSTIDLSIDDNDTGFEVPADGVLSLFTNNLEQMRLTGGNVGIGTTAPAAKLDIIGNIKITDGNQALGSVLTSDANGLATWQPAGGGSLQSAYDGGSTIEANNPTILLKSTQTGSLAAPQIQFGKDDGVGGLTLLGSIGVPGSSDDFEMFATNRIFFNTNFSTRMAIDATGQVGIGTITPVAKLDLLGNIKITDGTEGVGKVLTSDANGLASWQNAAASGWGLTGNTGTNPTTDFIGTTDAQPFNIRVENLRVMRYEYNGAVAEPAPSIIGGHPQNSVAAGVAGATIAGGGYTNPNVANGDWAAIGGGRDNVAGTAGNGKYSTIAGGASNRSLFQFSSVGGGRSNTASGRGATVPGGMHLLASGMGMTAVGTANENTAFSANSWVATEPIFVVGNGEVNPADNTVVGRSNAMTILKNGNVGIGISAPTAKLDLVGSVKIVDGNQGAGKILTSDANGLASWADPGGSTLINASGTNNLFAGVGAGIVNTATNQAFFGAGAGQANTTGAENTFIGRLAGNSNISGGFNVYVGKEAGRNSVAGGLNTYVGYQAGAGATGNGNTFLGGQSGDAATGLRNTFLGEKTGRSTTGDDNLFIGRLSGAANTTGLQNTLLGTESNVGASGLQNATAIGFRASVNQSNSLVLGSISGVNGATASTNVGIGTTTPAHKLTVAGGNIGMDHEAVVLAKNFSGTYEPFLYPRFAASNGTVLQIGDGGFVIRDNLTNTRMSITSSGSVGIGTSGPDQLLSVNGNASKIGGGSWLSFSDRRVKKDISQFNDGLSVLKQFNPVKYKFNGLAGYNDDGKEYIGVIAQEVQPIAPYMISTVNKKLRETDTSTTDILMYDGSALTYVLVNAVKEQQKMIETQQEEIEKLKAEVLMLNAQKTDVKTTDNTLLEVRLNAMMAEIEKLKSIVGAEASAPVKKEEKKNEE